MNRRQLLTSMMALPLSCLALLGIKKVQAAPIGRAAAIDLVNRMSPMERFQHLVADLPQNHVYRAFETIQLSDGQAAEFPLDIIAPNEKVGYAGAIVRCGKNNLNVIGHDYVHIPTSLNGSVEGHINKFLDMCIRYGSIKTVKVKDIKHIREDKNFNEWRNAVHPNFRFSFRNESVYRYKNGVVVVPSDSCVIPYYEHGGFGIGCLDAARMCYVQQS
jgi:hypothetical protein